MKFFVTGINGFVGRNLVDYLGRNNTKNLNLRADWMKMMAANNRLSIIHLAGKAHDLKSTSNPDEYYHVNYELTKKLYDAFLKSEAKKFIFISSVKAAADLVDGVLTEETVPNPQTHYGKSKLIAEEYIQNQPLPEDKSYYILRPCMIHGPGNKGNLNLLYKFVQKGIPYPLAAFHNKRSFLSIENLCFIIKALLEKDVPSGVYNLADDEALSTNEVVSILAASLNRAPKLLAIPVALIKTLATVGDFLNFPLNSERLNKLTTNYVVSNEKIKKALALGLPIVAKDGLVATVSALNS